MSLLSFSSASPSGSPSADQDNRGLQAVSARKPVTPLPDLFQSAVEDRVCRRFFKENFTGERLASMRLDKAPKLSHALPEFKSFCKFVESKFKAVNFDQRDFLKTALAQNRSTGSINFTELINEVGLDLPRIDKDLKRIYWGMVCGAGLGSFVLLGLGFVLPVFFFLPVWTCLPCWAASFGLLIACSEYLDYRLNNILEGKKGMLDKAWRNFIEIFLQLEEGEVIQSEEAAADALVPHLELFLGVFCVKLEDLVSHTKSVFLLTQCAKDFFAQQRSLTGDIV